MKECECPLEHSVGKLGHNTECPWYRSDQPTALQPGLLDPLLGCPPRHVDGTPHDFVWATRADSRSTTGVCRCGLADIDQAVMFGD